VSDLPNAPAEKFLLQYILYPIKFFLNSAYNCVRQWRNQGWGRNLLSEREPQGATKSGNETKKMKRVLVLAVALFSMTWGSAFADFYSFSFEGVGITVLGTLDVTSDGDGWLTATSGSGTANGIPITLYPGQGTIPNTFTYDNLLYAKPTSSQGFLTNTGGLLFTANSTPSVGYLSGNDVPTWINVYWNVNSGWPGATGTGDYTYYEGFNGGYVTATSVNGTFTASAIPVPPSLLLLAPGLLGFMLLRKRFKA